MIATVEVFDSKVSEFAATCGVTPADARLFVALVSHGIGKGLTLEAAIKRGEGVLVQVLANIQQHPAAARQLVADCFYGVTK